MEYTPDSAIAVLRDGGVKDTIHQIHAPHFRERGDKWRGRQKIFAAYQIKRMQFAVGRQYIERLAESGRAAGARRWSDHRRGRQSIGAQPAIAAFGSSFRQSVFSQKIFPGVAVNDENFARYSRGDHQILHTLRVATLARTKGAVRLLRPWPRSPV